MLGTWVIPIAFRQGEAPRMVDGPTVKPGRDSGANIPPRNKTSFEGRTPTRQSSGVLVLRASTNAAVTSGGRAAPLKAQRTT